MGSLQSVLTQVDEPSHCKTQNSKPMLHLGASQLLYRNRFCPLVVNCFDLRKISRGHSPDRRPFPTLASAIGTPCAFAR
jgi:hypothetical protein